MKRKRQTYKGKYKCKNPDKYQGRVGHIIYRSLWERKFMLYCDKVNAILEWSSEEVSIWYRSPVDTKMHRYYPDFWIKYIDLRGDTVEKLIEVKPKAQTIKPREKFWRTYKTYQINEAKWNSAIQYCREDGMQFQILTEDHLF